MNMYLRKPNFKSAILRKYDVLRLVNKVYRISEVIATIKYRKGVKYLYCKYEELLKNTGKTTYQVSKDTGIAQSTLSEWKSGRSKPKVEKLKILADYFGVDVGYFLE